LGNQPRGIYALMIMPERSFGRLVRYRRTKLGLSQTKLAELVGRSTATVRSWERDLSRPNDPKVLTALAAILAIDERQLFEKTETEPPVPEETSPTIEQALATLSPTGPEATGFVIEPVDSGLDLWGDEAETIPPAADRIARHEVVLGADREADVRDDVLPPPGHTATPAYAAPPEPFVQTPLTPSLADLSYVEDESQRQLYRVRNLATLVAAVALVVAFIWALGEGLGALGDWWDDFFSNLRL